MEAQDLTGLRLSVKVRDLDEPAEGCSYFPLNAKRAQGVSSRYENLDGPGIGTGDLQ